MQALHLCPERLPPPPPTAACLPATGPSSVTAIPRLSSVAWATGYACGSLCASCTVNAKATMLFAQSQVAPHQPAKVSC